MCVFALCVGLIEEFEFFSRNELNPKKEIDANLVSLFIYYKIYGCFVSNMYIRIICV